MQGNLACVDAVEGAAWLMGSSHLDAAGSLDVFNTLMSNCFKEGERNRDTNNINPGL